MSSPPGLEFEYEITADDYTSAAILYHKLSGKSRLASGWLFSGACLLVIGLLERDRGLSPIVLGAIGVWWMWAGIARVFPGGPFRRAYVKYYRELGLEGKKYRASVNTDGFQVVGASSSWTRRWVEVSPKGEDKLVFLFFSEGTLFIFAKRYLVEQQQDALRSLAGLPAR